MSQKREVTTSLFAALPLAGAQRTAAPLRGISDPGGQLGICVALCRVPRPFPFFTAKLCGWPSLGEELENSVIVFISIGGMRKLELGYRLVDSLDLTPRSMKILEPGRSKFEPWLPRYRPNDLGKLVLFCFVSNNRLYF